MDYVPSWYAATRDPDRTRAAILAAATAEFTANGLTGARVDAIAKRHGLPPWRRRFQGETSEGTLERERVEARQRQRRLAVVAGISQINAPFKGGVLVPSNNVLLAFPTSGAGQAVMAISPASTNRRAAAATGVDVS